jgi:hypothetical protein
MSCPLQKGMSQKSEIKKIDAWLHPIIATTNLQVVLKMSYGCEQIENRIDRKQHRKSAVQQRRIAADSSAPYRIVKWHELGDQANQAEAGFE